MRKLAFAVGALVLLLAPLAHAATPSGGWTDPKPTGDIGGVPLTYMQKPQQVRGSADFSGGIASVSFTLVQDAANTSPSDPCSAAKAVQPQSIQPNNATHVDFAFDAPFPCNRKYEVRATITPSNRALQNDTPLFLSLWVGAAIPPAPVSTVSATTLSGDARGVALRWDAPVQAPDLQGYEILRAVDGGSFEHIADADPGTTSWTDHAMPRNGGTLRYQVLGMRPGPETSTTVFATSSPTGTARVDPVPSTTPPAGDGGSSGGGGSAGGVSGGGGGGGGDQAFRGPGGITGSFSNGNDGPHTVHQEFTVPGATAHEPTTVDTGFNDKLPFQKRKPGAANGSQDAIANLDGGGAEEAAKPYVLFVGGAGVALSWAMLLRFITKRAASYY